LKIARLSTVRQCGKDKLMFHYELWRNFHKLVTKWTKLLVPLRWDCCPLRSDRAFEISKRPFVTKLYIRFPDVSQRLSYFKVVQVILIYLYPRQLLNQFMIMLI